MDVRRIDTDRTFITSPAALLRELELDPALPCLDYARRNQFPLHVPRAFVRRMRHGDPHDPLFVQVWPAAAEAVETPGFSFDAVGELGRRETGGVIRKYHGRALIVTTGACAVNCRYCFRRHFPYAESAADGRDWSATLGALAADSSVSEAILSGGDPLSLSDAKLVALVRGLDTIPHLRRLRIHTRVPIVQPARVNDAFIDWLAHGRLQRIVVVHVNHANEIDAEVTAACRRMRDAGALLLNQSVLLHGVNDSSEALSALSYRLCEVGILPYYLHLLDRVQGAAHFEVQESQAARLMKELVAELPGYLVPRLVREMSGQPAKMRVQWSD